MEESLNSIKNKGVKVKWITQTPELDKLSKIFEILSKNNHIKVMCLPEDSTVKFAMTDEQEITLAVFEEGNFAEAPGLVTNSPAVISLAKNYFEIYWTKGRELNKNKTTKKLASSQENREHMAKENEKPLQK